MPMDRDLFYKGLMDYYKGRYDKSEACLGDIVALLKDTPDDQLGVAIADRLVHHYDYQGRR